MSPSSLATGFDHASSVLSDGTNVFFFGRGWHDDGGSQDESRFVQVPVSGGPSTVRFQFGSADPQGTVASDGDGIAFDGSDVYFCAGAHTFKMPVASGGAVDLTPMAAPPHGIASGYFGCSTLVVDATNVYSGNGSNTYLMWSLAKTGGTPTYFAGSVLPTAAWATDAIASDGTYVYWIPSNGSGSYGTLVRALGSGGTPQVIVAPGMADGSTNEYLETAGTLLLTGGNLYWMQTTYPDTFWRVPTTGGDPVAIHTIDTIKTGNVFQGGPVSDGTNLYWVEQSGTSIYSIQKMPLAGAATSTLVVDGINWVGRAGAAVPSLAVDNANVYWLGPPNLYKAPK